MHRLSSLLFTILIFGLSHLCLAQDAPTQFDPRPNATMAKVKGFIISSDEFERDNENEIITLKGQVKVIYKTQYFEAEYIQIDLKNKNVILKGQVKVQTLNYELGGEDVEINYETNSAKVHQGFVQSNNIRFQGDYIEKKSENEFFVDNADYTTCTNCPATWSFEGNKIEAELGGYAYLKNTFLKVGGIPVFWLPYLVVPLKSDRQTGLLTPEIGYLRNRQLVLSQSYFWAMSRSEDSTFTLKNYELGGLKPLFEHRYVINETSNGITKGAYFFNDKVFTSESRYNTYRSSVDQDAKFSRWAINAYHQYTPSESEKIRLQLMLTSDLQYPKDFYDEFTNYSDSSLENKISYSKNYTHSLITAEAAYYRNLLQADPISSNNSSVHRLPEIRFDETLQQINNLPLYYSVGANFTRFSRTRDYDDISTFSDGQRYVSNSNSDPTCENNGNPNCVQVEDGAFNDSNDIIRTGNRFIFKGSLTTDAYDIGSGTTLTPKISYNEYDYFFPVSEKNNASRRYMQFELNSRTKFFKVYDEDYNASGIKYKNEIIPEIRYSWIPWIQQSDHTSFFGPSNAAEAPYSSRSIISDADVNKQGGILYDYDDRIYDRHIVSFSLLNRLIRKKRIDNTYKTILNFRLTQSYDLHQSLNGTNSDQPLSDLAGVLTLDLDQIQSYTQVNYYPYLAATDTLTSLSYLNENQQYFKIGLASKRTQEPKQDDVSFAIGFVSSYINLLAGVVFDASEDRDSTSRLKKVSLITQLKPPGDCWAINFYRDQKVGLEAEWKIKFDFSFDGKPTKVIPPAELNIN